MIVLPRLYPILDAGCFPNALDLITAAEELAAAGCTLMQYRNKSGNSRVILEQARELRRLFSSQSQNTHFSQNQGEVGHPLSARLIMNDRADLCLAAEFDGLHVGQDDLSPEAVRRIIGSDRWMGGSTLRRTILSNFSKRTSLPRIILPSGRCSPHPARTSQIPSWASTACAGRGL